MSTRKRFSEKENDLLIFLINEKNCTYDQVATALNRTPSSISTQVWRLRQQGYDIQYLHAKRPKRVTEQPQAVYEAKPQRPVVVTKDYAYYNADFDYKEPSNFPVYVLAAILVAIFSAIVIIGTT